MVVIIPDKKIRNVKLTGDELDVIIEELERIPHNVFTFFDFGKTIKKLKEAREK